MSDLFGNPEDRFSHVEAPFILFVFVLVVLRFSNKKKKKPAKKEGQSCC